MRAMKNFIEKKNDGFGLTTAGNLIVQEIFERYGEKINLTVTSAKKGEIDAWGKCAKAILYDDILDSLEAFVDYAGGKKQTNTKGISAQ